MHGMKAKKKKLGYTALAFIVCKNI